MLEHWHKLLTNDCTVVRIGTHVVYPIHRVGHTSLMYAADEKYTNDQIATLTHIDVLWRDPNQRFVSGVNEYSRQQGMEVSQVYDRINKDNLVNSHFMPQYLWLMNLYRFYKGEITFKPFEYIGNITDVHKRDDKNKYGEKIYVEPLEQFVNVDKKIIEDTKVRKTYFLQDIIKDYKHVLS